MTQVDLCGLLDAGMEGERMNPAQTGADPQAIAFDRLSALAREHEHPLQDLLDWYREDLDAFACLPHEQVRWIVEDYVRHRDIYRPAPPAPAPAATEVPST